MRRSIRTRAAAVAVALAATFGGVAVASDLPDQVSAPSESTEVSAWGWGGAWGGLFRGYINRQHAQPKWCFLSYCEGGQLA